ncbi:uncharacterized protein LOC111383806 [Olea europaea var. sylvestris]|uniref:uncharacterized protein LOC111383806 n=1 Tax=Olea europaea var. sylvestris TaxID=158386 RepID=UPI000C1D4ADF|nr:uncharacterized protein LOC111383806 [Olea europaea var. sylvestris]
MASHGNNDVNNGSNIVGTGVPNPEMTIVNLMETTTDISPIDGIIGDEIPHVGVNPTLPSAAASAIQFGTIPLPVPRAGTSNKMVFYLTTLGLARFLTEDAPIMAENETDVHRRAAWDAWKSADFFCRNYVLDGLQNSLWLLLPSQWKAFKSYLQHKRKEMSFEDLIIKLRIEEDNKRAERKSENSYSEKANVLEYDQSGVGKKPKFQFNGKCFNCDKVGHRSADCHQPRRDNKQRPQANMVGNERDHLSDEMSMFTTFIPVTNCEKLFMGNSATSEVLGKGKVILKMTSGKELTLTNVLYVPEIRKNLVSGSLLSKNGFRMVFEVDKLVITKIGVYVGKCYMTDSLFKLNVIVVTPTIMSNEKTPSVYLLESPNLFQIDSNHKCETCVESKLTGSLFHSIERSIEPLGLVHSDVLRSDHGSEYESPFGEFCAKHGIIHKTTEPYSPQQNEIAERKNRTLKKMMNAMLISSGLPQKMWGEAILFANYILNKVLRKNMDKTPYELWTNRTPSYKYLRMWGGLAKVVVPLPKKIKIGHKTVDCVLIGYAQNSSAYRFLVHYSNVPDIHPNTIMEYGNAQFFENIFPCKSPKQLTPIKRTMESSASSSSKDPIEEGEDEPRRSKRTKTSKTFWP